MALISDEFYEAAKTSCNETYVNVDPSNTECWTALGAIKRCVKDLYGDDILEPKFVFASPKENPDLGRRSVQEDPTEFILSPPRILNIGAGTVMERKRSNKSLAYTKDVQSVVEVHKNLSTLGLEVLGECGDCDMVVPFVGMIEWIKRLNLTTVNDWQPWFVDGQVAGALDTQL
ncbi:serine carboxypeptidase-like 17 [Eucalyptus grandis]|uniref:serine carboxypeptidase-like 17 n=1 Tax=Eucalyptus grandis TaxID=71139 RepID=UPI00192E85C7|nr:serine carboxypeptidase-like 17 [Eucalyptus grandis]